MYLNTRGIAVVVYKQWRPREKGGREGEEGEEEEEGREGGRGRRERRERREGEREVMYISLYKQKNGKRFN